jgi:hypothetical protein
LQRIWVDTIINNETKIVAYEAYHRSVPSRKCHNRDALRVVTFDKQQRAFFAIVERKLDALERYEIYLAPLDPYTGCMMMLENRASTHELEPRVLVRSDVSNFLNARTKAPERPARFANSYNS